jgi:hypothetical protein
MGRALVAQQNTIRKIVGGWDRSEPEKHTYIAALYAALQDQLWKQTTTVDPQTGIRGKGRRFTFTTCMDKALHLATHGDPKESATSKARASVELYLANEANKAK